MERPADHGPLERATLVRELRDAYTAALLIGDDVRAERAVREAIDAGLEEEAIQREVIGASMRRVGELWEDGTMTIADEHLATQITLRVVALEREAFRVARGRGARTVLLGAVEGEQHTVGIQMVSNLLGNGGYDARFLGADVPIDALDPITVKHRPDAFALSATMPESGELLPLAIDEIRRSRPSTAVLVGGRGVPSTLRDESGLTVARGAASAVELLDALVRRPELN
jgi:MerR family transcriptional regulator, light-induced transcriptional regulator